MIIHVAKPASCMCPQQYEEMAANSFAFKTGLPYTKFRKFIPLRELLSSIGGSHLEYVRKLRKSKNVHLLMLDSGKTYMHPKTFIAVLQKEIQTMTIQELL